jgi:hypothetical protein
MKRIPLIFSLVGLLWVAGSCKQEPRIDDVPLLDRLAQEWKHSTEEAQPGRDVYRTAAFQFPNQAYRQTYRFTPDQRLTISYQTANGTVRYFPGTWVLSEDEQTLTISGINPVGLRPYVVRWRLINLRSDLLLVEPLS